MNRKTRLLSALCFVGCLFAPMVAGAVPLQLAHHGTLYSSAGEPVTGSVEITFSLWDDEDTGAQVWSEVRTVDVVDGVYSTLLGSESAVDAVLKAEPALWLQLEIAEEALLPRHPVASAPYAIIADTAINVDGGTVNATSVSVGGTEVIDSSGSWTGGAGSIAWNAVAGAPDTLGGLSCADGDRAVWNDSNQLWECGSATVALDRLDVGAGSEGDVLTIDSGAASWASAGLGSSGCSLSSSTGGVATLDCGGTPIRLTTAENYIDLIDERTRLRADGTIKDFSGVAPAGTFASLFGNAYVGCATTSSGSMTCWPRTEVGLIVQPPAGSYQGGACGYSDACCAITQAGAAVCWDPQWGNTGMGVLSGIPSGVVIDLALYGGQAGCAITATGTVECWGALAGLQTNKPTGTGYTRIGTDGSRFCAAGPAGGECWSNSASAVFTVPPGDYVQLEGLFGLLATGEVLDFQTPGGAISEELFAALGRAANSRLGVTTDGRLAPLLGWSGLWPGR